MDKKVSIIIPVYNAEKYLEESISSAINQTYKNIEILIVNDGSVDNSGVICDSLSKQDDRIQVFHNKNVGAAAARNIALNAATGDYLMFLDADDFLEFDAVENMSRAIEEKNADFVIGNYINTNESGEKWDSPAFDCEQFKECQLYITNPYSSFFLMNSSACNKIFRRDFIEKNNLRFKEGLKAEDAIFTTSCFIKSERVFFVPIIMYNYRQRRGDSVSTSCSSQFFSSINRAYYEIYQNFKNSNNLAYYRYFFVKSINYMIYKFIDSDILTYDERITVLNEMMWFYKLSKELQVNPCQECTTKVVDMIVSNKLDLALEYCDIIRECRTFMTGPEKEQMSKPAKETYKEISKLDDNF